MERLTRRNEYGDIEIIEVDKYDWLDGDDWCRVAQHLAERLNAFEDAEEQGRLVVLPCKVGDWVSIITSGSLEIRKVIGIKKDYGYPWKIVVKEKGRKTRELKFEQFGETVFLDDKAAEAALTANNDSTGG